MKFLSSVLIVCIFFLITNDALAAAASSLQGRRSIDLTYSINISALNNDNHKDAKLLRVWIPVPSEDTHQRILDIDIVNAPADVELNMDALWGNSMIYFELPARLSKGLDFEIRYRIERIDDVMAMGVEPHSHEDKSQLFKRFLEPSRQAIQDKRVKRLAERAVKGRKGSLDKARGIYDFTLENMEYTNKIPGYGKGNVNRACLAIGEGKKGSGNCTDFHSLFTALMGVEQIPSVFEMGISLKEKNAKNVEAEGYHCWVSFFVPGKGWVAADLSEAVKTPSKRDYYFGAIDSDRIKFSQGRDILLNPAQEGEPLNFFGPAPYMELGALPFTDFELKITYSDIK